MSKKVTTFLSLLLVLVLGLSLAAHGDSAGDSANPDALTITFSLDQGLAEITQSVVDDYNASQDKYKVELVVLPQDTNTVHDDFVNKLAAEDTSVDIMNLDGTYIAEFASAGWLLDLGAYFDASAQDQFLPGSIDQMTYQGTLVAMPYLTNASVLFYRQDVLDQIGAEAPTTYQGWMDLADKAIGVNGVEYISLFQANQSEALVCNWCEFIWNNGGDVLDENGLPVANSANNLEATNIMLDLVQNYSPEGIITYAEPESEQVFLEGKALFLRDWSGFWVTANDEEKSKVAGNVGVAFLPTGPLGDAGHSCLGGSGLVVNKFIDMDHQDGAADFIAYITSFEVQKKICLESAQPPVVKDVYTDADVLATIPFYADFGKVIEEAKARPKSPDYAKTSDAIQRNIHQALSGDVDVETALNNLQAELEAILN